MKKIVVDTAKINNETLKLVNEYKESLDKAIMYLGKVNEIKFPEMTSNLEFIKKGLNTHRDMCFYYIKHLNKIVKNFNEFTSSTIKKTSSIEKVNAHVLIGKK